ncbi:MAG: glycolate oxidase subunit GlcE [Proteobacteria bacterium]|nr:glycolate oxidase subunit GlcE [Pseudomonadota bacterium]
MTADVVAEWQDRIRAAAAARTPLAIVGGGTKAFYGNPTAGELLDTRACAGIVDYEPTELVLVARAGTPLAEIEQRLADAGQMLAFEPPHFGPGATLGGVVAAGLSGPRRPWGGAVRDLVLGLSVVDGHGTLLRFGGRVMKNVAGFDATRLMVGALGTLGVITEVALKCLPVPRCDATRAFECGADAAIQMTNDWSARGLPLSATCYWRGTLAVRLSGAEPAVVQAMRTLGGTSVDNATSFWASVREQTHDFFADGARTGDALWRLSVGATSPHAGLGGEQLIEWGGALRWLWQPSSIDAATVRQRAAQAHGHATLFRGSDAVRVAHGTFAPLPAPLHAIHERLKATFDPARILNRDRLYAGL